MRKQNESDGWWQFLKLCAQVKTEKRFDDFFFLFLTDEERKYLAQRCLIVKELVKKEKTQREISKTLKTSISKITRGSNCLKTITEDLRKFLKDQLVSV